VVTRFLVIRSNHIPFVITSYGPMAAMLFLRCVSTLAPVDLVLALLVPLYAIQLLLDSSHISDRWDQEALMRFSHEDLSRELEEARDEALMKRTEAERANVGKSRFLAAASHDLRQPLQTISLLQGTLEKRVRDEDSGVAGESCDAGRGGEQRRPNVELLDESLAGLAFGAAIEPATQSRQARE